MMLTILLLKPFQIHIRFVWSTIQPLSYYKLSHLGDYPQRIVYLAMDADNRLLDTNNELSFPI